MPQITLENGSKVEISQESYDNLVNAVQEWPKMKERYWYGGSRGTIYSDLWQDDAIDRKHKAQNNIYRTREDAEMGSKRDRLMRTPNTAEKEDSSFYAWNFYAKNSITLDGCYWGAWLNQPKFATKKEAKDWGKEAQEVFEHFNQ